MPPFIVITGCSAGGKSTLLGELARRGHAVVEEPGRRIVREEQASGGGALPWIDLAAFARRALAMAEADLQLAGAETGWTFFDRSAIDAASALQHLGDATALADCHARCRYHPTVFVAPPWPELFDADPERRHSIAEAVAEYERLRHDYAALGYGLVMLPRTGVAARADFVLNQLGEPARSARRGS